MENELEIQDAKEFEDIAAEEGNEIEDGNENLIEIVAEKDSERLDTFLAEELDFSRTRVVNMLRNKLI